MCMLMSVGFIMIARLNYDKCVKQFVIAVLGTVIMFLVPWLIKSVKSFRNFGWIYCAAGRNRKDSVCYVCCIYV